MLIHVLTLRPDGTQILSQKEVPEDYFPQREESLQETVDAEQK